MKVTQEIARELLHYDPETGEFTWRARHRSWFSTDRVWKVFNTRDAGKVAGSLTTSKKNTRCIRIRVLGEMWFAHRLAWIYMLGNPLPGEIDHKNGNGWDNRWENLRSGDNWVNHSNKCMLSSNTSGHMGVSWHKQMGKWRAYIKKGSGQKSLGLYHSKEEAAEVVRKAYLDMGFDPRHGSKRPY